MKKKKNTTDYKFDIQEENRLLSIFNTKIKKVVSSRSIDERFM